MTDFVIMLAVSTTLLVLVNKYILDNVTSSLAGLATLPVDMLIVAALALIALSESTSQEGAVAGLCLAIALNMVYKVVRGTKKDV